MTTTYPRINVSLNKRERSFIKSFATSKEMSMSEAVKYAVNHLMEMEDEIYLAKLAKERHTDDPKDFVSYDEAIKKYL